MIHQINYFLTLINSNVNSINIRIWKIEENPDARRKIMSKCIEKRKQKLKKKEKKCKKV